MKFSSLQPFVPSGRDFDRSKSLFQDLGFNLIWDNGDYVSFEKDGCRFILQHFDDKHFAENLMISVSVDDAKAFYASVIDKKLSEQYGVRISKPIQQPYGLEVNLIDIAGVCWHFVEG